MFDSTLGMAREDFTVDPLGLDESFFLLQIDRPDDILVVLTAFQELASRAPALSTRRDSAHPGHKEEVRNPSET